MCCGYTQKMKMKFSCGEQEIKREKVEIEIRKNAPQKVYNQHLALCKHFYPVDNETVNIYLLILLRSVMISTRDWGIELKKFFNNFSLLLLALVKYIHFFFPPFINVNARNFLQHYSRCSQCIC